MSSQVFMARQPICDRSGRVAAYELLYRSSTPRGSEPLSDQESAEALIRSLVDVGLDTLVPNHLAFVNIPASLLGSPAIHLLPRDRTVLEILEDTPFNDDTERELRSLKLAGYRLAFDDCTFAPTHRKFFPFVQIVKVDILETPPQVLVPQVRALKKAGIQVLAEKVETQDIYRNCRELGCDLFQGYFFAKPEIVKGSRMPHHRQSILHVLTRLQDQSTTIAELEQLISSDVALSYRLLRLLNSAAVGLPQRIESIRQAVLFVGLDKLTALAGLLLMTSMGKENNELITTAMVRARMCERLAMIKGIRDPHRFFTVGLFSVLDALSGQPMVEVIAPLPLAAEISDALLDRNANSPMSLALRSSLAYERGEFDEAIKWLSDDLDGMIPLAYSDAVGWATNMSQYIAA
jgi:EAL and modified HD-GYP domain-containing signal transduction protein